MKKFCAMLLLLTLCVMCAQADANDLTNCAVANGAVSAVKHVDILAPYSGTLMPFDWEAGDLVNAGQTLFTMRTTTIYATESAWVKAIYCEEGDDATAVMARYGGLIGMQPESEFTIAASTATAYDDRENRIVDVGEILHFRSSKANHSVGTGRVTYVNGTDYLVEVLTGDFEPGESFSLFRSKNRAQTDLVGRGMVNRRETLMAAGQGRVAKVLVKEGDYVENGTPLLTLMPTATTPDASPEVVAAQNGVLGQVAVMPGQQVYEGQVLCRLLLVDELEVLAQVDEVDLGDLYVGDKVSITLDMDADNVMTGTVTEISHVGATVQNAAYFTVHVQLPTNQALIGASASVYIPKK